MTALAKKQEPGDATALNLFLTSVYFTDAEVRCSSVFVVVVN